MKHDIEQVIPGFTDMKQQPHILAHLAAYAKRMGFQNDEIEGMRDRRILLMVYKAMMFDHVIEDRVNRGKK